jgi:hypothetical protein
VSPAIYSKAEFVVGSYAHAHAHPLTSASASASISVSIGGQAMVIVLTVDWSFLIIGCFRRAVVVTTCIMRAYDII